MTRIKLEQIPFAKTIFGPPSLECSTQTHDGFIPGPLSPVPPSFFLCSFFSPSVHFLVFHRLTFSGGCCGRNSFLLWGSLTPVLKLIPEKSSRDRERVCQLETALYFIMFIHCIRLAQRNAIFFMFSMHLPITATLIEIHE